MSEQNNQIRFCEIGVSSKDGEPLIFDLEKQMTITSDTTSEFGVIESEDYIGLVSPDALMVPSEKHLKAGKSMDWEVEGFSFSARPASTMDNSWYIVNASPNSAKTANFFHSTMLYSLENGVIAFRIYKDYNGEELSQEAYSCGDKKFFLTELIARDVIQ
ncbi:hypothetical protein [Paremcibacter congregatus]|nr:hypothetical protein [Paremcibacter congregatus]QDE28969.1 hypothetical protein FIV45_17635 [Paremcibacter congregatus]